MRRGLPLLWIVLGLGAVALLEPRLRAWRRELGLEPEAPADLELEEEVEGTRVAIIGASLGVFRPLAVNFLALRAERLERQGQTFESAALSRGITTLLPRLPAVWTSQAMKLAYDLSLGAPPRDRLHWVVEGVELLVVEARKFLALRPELDETLAFIFLERLGAFRRGDFDLRAEFVRALETRDGAERERGIFVLPPSFLEALAARLPEGARLDESSPFLHAVYWAEHGLARCDRSSQLGHRLLFYRSLACREQLAQGRGVRSYDGVALAWLPDPAWLELALASFAEERALHVGRPRLLRDVDEDERIYRDWATLHLALSDRRVEVAKLWASWGRDPSRLEDFLVTSLTENDLTTAPEVALGLLRLRCGLWLSAGDAALLDEVGRGLESLATAVVDAWNAAAADRPELAALPAIATLLERSLEELGSLLPEGEARARVRARLGREPSALLRPPGAGLRPRLLEPTRLEWLLPPDSRPKGAGAP